LKRALFAALTAAAFAASVAQAQGPDFKPVTQKMLLNPSADDWLMYSRTYDAQRFSPLKQITRQNVGQLKQVFTKELGAGPHESIPLVHDGVLYMQLPGATVQALDGATGKLLWEYKRPGGGSSRAKAIAIFEDMIYYNAPDSTIVALDARTGAMRWEAKTTGGLSSGSIVVDGKVITGRACGGVGANCYISAHDARTGKEVWKFYTTARDTDAEGAASWSGLPEAQRVAGTWALPGGYDPARNLIFWGVANPTPNSRSARHGKFDGLPTTSPADLYSNSTVALDPATGKLAWYYQHLPGDDWDEDYTNERTLIRTKVSPDPKFVKWINPDIKKGEQRDISVMVGEGGGIFALDRDKGQFLWATPFPDDNPNFLISNIDGKTGKVSLNTNVMFKEPGDRRVICYWNTRSYWPTAYHPRLNSLYVSYLENCLDMTIAGPAGRERRVGIPREGVDMDKWSGLAKINMETGEIKKIFQNHAPANGAVLATAGDVIFLGDLDHKFRAFDAESGKVLWETALNGPIQNSTITYSVNGKQYVAVFTGIGLNTVGIIDQAGIKPNRTYNALYIFALP
jgi:PQQ-dependent dehydrogenase (methanol/ethanol family)